MHRWLIPSPSESPRHRIASLPSRLPRGRARYPLPMRSSMEMDELALRHFELTRTLWKAEQILSAAAVDVHEKPDFRGEPIKVGGRRGHRGRRCSGFQ